MKKTILSKVETEFLINCLEELYEISSDVDLIDKKWMDKLEVTRKLFNLEMDYYKIRSDGNVPTKKQMIKWILLKVKNKTVDL